MKFNFSKVLQAVLCCLLWSTAIPVLKISYSELNFAPNDFYSRLILAGLRFLLAGILLLIFFMLTQKKLPKVEKSLFWPLVIFALLNTTLQYIFFYSGVMHTPPIKGALIDGSKALMVVILAHIFRHDDKITVFKIVGLLLGFAGIVVANRSELSENVFQLSMTFKGEGMLLISSLTSALAVVYGKKLMDKIHYLPLNIYQFLIGASILLVFGVLGAKGFPLRFTPLALGLLVYSAFLSAIAFVIWYKLIFEYNSSGVTVFIFLVPVFGSIISSLLFKDQTITFNVVLSLLLSTTGIIVLNIKNGANKVINKAA